MFYSRYREDEFLGSMEEQRFLAGVLQKNDKKGWEMLKNKRFMMGWFAMFLAFLLMASDAFGELRIDSVTPTVGVMGQDLQVTVKGSGFDANTKVSTYLDSGNRRKIIGSANIPGEAKSIKVKSNLAYIASGESGLQIIDISDPASLIIMGSVDTPGIASDVEILGDFAYVADSQEGIIKIDIRDSTIPKIIDSMLQYTEDIVISGTYAYVMDFPYITKIDLKNFVFSNIYTIPEVEDYFSYCVDKSFFAVDGNTAYVTCGDSTLMSMNYLFVVDISNSMAPAMKSINWIPGFATEIIVESKKTYVTYIDAELGSGLTIIDVNDPENPVEEGRITISGSPKSLFVVDNKAYISSSYGGLEIIDISVSSDPEFYSSIAIPGIVKAVANNDMAYVIDIDHGLQVIDVSRLNKLNIINVQDAKYALGIALDSKMAYVVANAENPFYGQCGFFGGTLSVIDVNDPINPVLKAIAYTGCALDVSVESDKAYVAINGFGEDLGGVDPSIKIFDVSTPSNPEEISSFSIPNYNPNGITISSNKAYLTPNLYIIDISDPYFPTYSGSIDTPGFAGDVIVNSNRAYVADGSEGVQIIDISNMASLNIIENIDTPGEASALSLFGNILYIADGDGGLQIADLNMPPSQKLIGHADTPGYAYDITVIENFAYIADGEGGLTAFDVTDPKAPQFIGSVFTGGYAYGLSVKDSFAFIANNDKGLSIAPLPIKISSITVVDENTLTLTIPSPPIPGHYTLRAFNNNGESDELPGAITFVEQNSRILEKKAIIVAGMGSDTDRVWKETQRVANHAYNMLKVQGYNDERIKYLSSDSTAEGVDGSATFDSVSSAIQEWSTDASDLLVYFVGHGQSDIFNINPTETISSHTLDSWFDVLQNNLPGKLIFIYEACISGTFLPVLSTDSQNRIIITSGSDQYSWFINYGTTSFSFIFWSVLSTDAKYQHK